MHPLWFILGLLLLLVGIFERQVFLLLGIKPMSAVFTDPSLAQSRRLIEKIGQWLVTTLGLSFLVQGLNGILPDNLSSIISFVLAGLVGLMIIVIIGVTVAKWKIK